MLSVKAPAIASTPVPPATARIHWGSAPAPTAPAKVPAPVPAIGAGLVDGIMATKGAARLDGIRSRREERREGDVTFIREPGRTISG